MASDKSKLTNKQYKSALRVLKKRGLYSGDARKAPTKYAKGLVNKLRDVVQGRAAVVTIKKQSRPSKRFVGPIIPGGIKTTRTFRNLGFITKRNKVVVPINTARGERATYNKKRNIITRTTKANGEIYRRFRIPFKRGTPVDRLPELKDNQRFSIPFNRGRRGVDFQNYTRDELMQIIAQYTLPDAKGEIRWEDIEDFIYITEHEGGEPDDETFEDNGLEENWVPNSIRKLKRKARKR